MLPVAEKPSVPNVGGEPWLRVALIVRPHGHRGEVLAELLTDFPERFSGRPQIHMRGPRTEEPNQTVTVEKYRLQGGRVILQLTECTSMNEAELLRGFELVVPWEARTVLPEDEIYVAELVGCTLVDARAGRPIGTVIDVDRESSNVELLIVRIEDGGSGAELLIPFVKAYAPRWDLAARTLHMELPEGLAELPSDEAGRADKSR